MDGDDFRKDRICSRCAAFPWATLLDSRSWTSYDTWPSFEESHDELKSSDCRICKFLSTIKPPLPPGYAPCKQLMCFSSDQGSPFKGTINFVSWGPSRKVFYPGIAFLHEQDWSDELRDNNFVNFGNAAAWIAHCCTQHPDTCSLDASAHLSGLRLIDCERRLVHPAPAKYSFAALSYVWGVSSHQSNLTNGNLPTRLPRTVEDAITTTSRLGYRYLWIDRYCINQGDPDHIRTQIQQMGQIYASAAFAIIAASGKNPYHGLPGVSLPRQKQSPWAEVDSVALVQIGSDVMQDICNSTWASRAWTFQEGYMSRRKLFFSESAILYVCGAEEACDMTKGMRLQRVENLGAFISERCFTSFSWISHPILARGTRYMQEYSGRALTYDSDALDAIIGILNYETDHLVNQPGREEDHRFCYIWGVPMVLEFNLTNWDGLSIQMVLNWTHTKPCRRRAGFPSWSSLAWDGPISYFREQPRTPFETFQINFRRPDLIDLRDYFSANHAFNGRGKNTPARLEVIHGSVFPLNLVPSCTKEPLPVVPLELDIDISLCVQWDIAIEDIDENRHFIGFRTVRSHHSQKEVFLIVLENFGGYYERFGAINFPVENYVRWHLPCRDAVTGDYITNNRRLDALLNRPFCIRTETKQNFILA